MLAAILQAPLENEDQTAMRNQRGGWPSILDLTFQAIFLQGLVVGLSQLEKDKINPRQLALYTLIDNLESRIN